MKRFASRVAWMVWAALFFSQPLLRAQVVYSTLDPSGTTYTQALGASGNSVVGYYIDSQSVAHGFLYNGGTYTTLDPLDTIETTATGVSGNNAVGYYTDSSEVTHGFLYDGSTYTTLDPPGSTDTTATGVSGNNVVGYYTDGSKVVHGFLYDGSTYTTLDPSGSIETTVTGVSGNNVVGSYFDSSGVMHGFLYDGSTYTTLDPSGTTDTEAYGISGDNVVGSYYDASDVEHGFLYSGGTYTALDPSGSIGTTATGVSGNNVVGYFTDSSNVTHGFLYNGSTYTPFDPSGSIDTTATGVSGNNVVGQYTDSSNVTHGFLATFEATDTATVTLGNLTPTYNGAPRAATATTNPPGLNVTFTYNGNATAPTAAGSYTVVATVNDPIYTGSATGTLVIAQASATVTLGDLTPTYDGAPQAVTATTNPPGLNVSFTYNGNTAAPTNAGSFTVIGTVNDPNYAGSATGTLVIAQASATVTLGDLTPTYDGAPQAVTATTNPPGLNVTFTYNGNAATPTNAGNFTVIGTVSDPNYAGNARGTLVISHAAATVTLGDLTPTYDGAPQAATATTNPPGLNVTFTYNGNAAVPTNAGSFTVIGTVSDPNYAGNATGTLVIGQAAATVTLGDLTPTYNGAPHAATATTNPPGLDVTFTYNGNAATPTNVGSYTVVGTVTNPNYLGSATGTLVIGAIKTKATVKLGNLAATYDGASKAATATTTPSGLDVTFTYNGDNTAPTAAGSYVVVASINDPAYAGSATGTLVIAKAVATISLGNLATTYNGTAQPATATTVPSGLTVTFTYNDKATVPMAVGSYKVVGTISEANYQGSATGTLVVSKAAASVSLGSLAATYNGKAHAATATTGPAGLDVIFTYNGKATVPIAAGSYTVVGTVNNVSYQGSSTPQTLVISPATATVTLGNLNFAYTGAAHPATATTVPARLAVGFTYNGLATAPTLVGSYPVVATVNNPNYTGSTSGPLVISPVLPLATTSAATLITASSAKLNGITNPKGSATTVSFQYGTTTAYGNTTTGQSMAAGTANVAFSTGISLTPQTMPVIYHYRAVATNGAGTTLGADKTFATLALPIFGSSPGAYLGASGAEVSLSVNPNGVATSVSFQYSTSANFSTFLQTASQSVGAGKVPVNVYVLFPGLTASTLYYYRMVTTSVAGTSMSDPQSFTTLSFDTALVVQKGASATGTSTTFASFGNPAVNVNDSVAFAATLTLASGVTTANDVGIWTIDNTSTQHLIAQIGSGMTAPDTAANFLTLGDPVYNNNGAVAFRGTLKVATGQATSTTAAGIWSSSSGTLALVARQGSPAPGANGGTFDTFTSLGLSDSGGVIIYATLNASTAAGVTAANNIGIWQGNSTADLALVLRLGDTVNGETITKLTFLPVETCVNGQTRSFNSISGNIICGATFSDKTTGVIKIIGGTPHLKINFNDGTGIAGATFASFGNSTMNIHDYDALAATLAIGAGGVTTSNDLGIWDDDSTGAGRLIARSGSGPAPGTTASFLTFGDPVYNNNEVIAFRATLKVATGQATTTTATGIWCDSAGSLALVARQGIGQASGCPAGATFSAFTELALADQGGATNQGGVIFLGTLNVNAAAGVGATNNLGIWAVDTTGTLQLIVRTGDILNVNGSDKTVTGLEFLPSLTYVNGQSRSFAQGNGDLVYLATFSDKSTAIFNVVFP